MTILEQIAKMANRGELAEPSKVVECARTIKFDTNDYTDDGQQKNSSNGMPAIVDASTIKKEMEKGYRPERKEFNEDTETMPFIIDKLDND